jgi:hypothetical protein
VSEIFYLLFFFIKQYPWSPDSRAKVFWILQRFSEIWSIFERKKSCTWCQWHRLYFYFFAYHHRFTYDFHFSKLLEYFSVHAVSMTPHAFKKIRIPVSLRIRIYIRKGFIPLIRASGSMPQEVCFNETNRGSKIFKIKN